MLLEPLGTLRPPQDTHRQDPGFCAARDQRASIATGACCTACGAAATRIAGRGAIRRTLGDEDRGRGSRRYLLLSRLLRICDKANVGMQCKFNVLLEDYRLIGDSSRIADHASLGI